MNTKLQFKQRIINEKGQAIYHFLAIEIGKKNENYAQILVGDVIVNSVTMERSFSDSALYCLRMNYASKIEDRLVKLGNTMTADELIEKVNHECDNRIYDLLQERVWGLEKVFHSR